MIKVPGRGTPAMVTCPRPSHHGSAYVVWRRRAGDSSDLRHRVLACPVAGEEQPAPPQHEHEFDDEGAATSSRCSARNRDWSRHPATEHDPQGEPKQGGPVDREEPVRQGKGQYLHADPAGLSPHWPIGRVWRFPGAQTHHDAPDRDPDANSHRDHLAPEHRSPPRMIRVRARQGDRNGVEEGIPRPSQSRTQPVDWARYQAVQLPVRAYK